MPGAKQEVVPKVPMPSSSSTSSPKGTLNLTVPMPGSGTNFGANESKKEPFDAEIIITPKNKMFEKVIENEEASKNRFSIFSADSFQTAPEVDEISEPKSSCVPIIITKPDSNIQNPVQAKVVVTPRLHDKVDVRVEEKILEEPSRKYCGSDSDPDQHIYEDVEIPEAVENITKATLSINLSSDQASHDGIVIECRNERSANISNKSFKHESSDTEYEELEADEVAKKTSEFPTKIEEARIDLLEGIKHLDSTIENLKIGMIKVYEDVYAKPQKTKFDSEIVPKKDEIQVETVEILPNQSSLNEEISDEELRERINEEFRKNFFGLTKNDAEKENDEKFETQQVSSTEDLQ